MPRFVQFGVRLRDHECTYAAFCLAKALRPGLTRQSPAAVSASMLRTALLPRGLCGSDTRYITSAKLHPLFIPAKSLGIERFSISTLAAPEMLGCGRLFDALARRMRRFSSLSPPPAATSGVDLTARVEVSVASGAQLQVDCGLLRHRVHQCQAENEKQSKVDKNRSRSTELEAGDENNVSMSSRECETPSRRRSPGEDSPPHEFAVGPCSDRPLGGRLGVSQHGMSQLTKLSSMARN